MSDSFQQRYSGGEIEIVTIGKTDENYGTIASEQICKSSKQICDVNPHVSV